MLRVLACVGYEHDRWLVLLAAVVCITGSWIAMRLFSRARASTGSTWAGWLFLTGVATGASIWTTHFIAMLAFEPSVPTSYEPVLTILSLFIAIGATTLGFAVAAARPIRAAGELGGALVGLGIGAMHYTGMAAFRVAGAIDWDLTLVAVSVALGAALGAAALRQMVRTRAAYSQYVAAGILTLAICSLHFTAMGALAIAPDPSIVIPARTMSSEALALSVAGVALLVMGSGLSSYLIDSSARQESRGRLRRVADASAEGLVITDGARIRYANESFAKLSGYARDDLIDQGLFEDLLVCEARHLGSDADGRFECEMRTAAGELVPVEVTASAETSGEYRRFYSVRDLRERRESEKRLAHLALHDALTGLANRAAFNERLDRDLMAAARARGRLAVLCMNFNRFKEINDVFGHGVGDRALAEAARRMRECLREHEFLARLGGDEFAAVQLASRPEKASDLAGRLSEALEGRMSVGGHSLQLAVSAGIALYPADGVDREQLLANAAVAMYRAKTDSRAAFCFFKRDMDEAARRRHALSQELELAIERGEFELHYQVQKLVESGDICGFEALLRWRHPSRGIIPPAEFIPLAEETGLIIPIGEWVLRTACAIAASWDRPYKIAVNLSPVQFSQTNLSELVHGVLIDTGLSPARLELEVTESMLIADPERTLHVLRRLKLLGVTIAMDDFGTGYSSLSTLQAFPFDKIKIDRSFVDKVEKQHQAAAIVRAVLGLGKSLSIPVLAEGVESQQHLAFLRKEGCEEAQGYFFGRPVPISEIEHLVFDRATTAFPLRQVG
ncbi:MAG TPA: EAL domain-containing protein [Xanthobacteraceae bacterium]|nr:EAL domain-containing protein [Xanthobacteraceae bacterium]